MLFFSFFFVFLYFLLIFLQNYFYRFYFFNIELVKNLVLYCFLNTVNYYSVFLYNFFIMIFFKLFVDFIF